MVITQNKICVFKRQKSLGTHDYLVAFFLISFVITRIASLPTLLANFIPALIGLFCLAYTLIRKECNIKVEILSIACFLSLLEIVGISLNSNNSFYDLVWIWTYVGVASIIKTYNINSKFVLFQFYCVVAYFILCMVRGVAADQLLSIGSENNISIYLLLFVCLYLYTVEKNDSLPYIPIFLTMVVTLWSASRSGIMSTSILLLLVFIYNCKQTKEKKNHTTILFAIILSCLVIQYLITLDVLMEPIQAKMNRYGVESLRTLIWRDYINAVVNSPFQFFFGVDLHDNANFWLSHYGNPHNSFFTLHANFGITGVVFVFFVIVLNIIMACTQKDFICLIILITAVSRCFFDWAAFSGPFDVLFYAMALACFSNRRIHT